MKETGYSSKEATWLSDPSVDVEERAAMFRSKLSPRVVFMIGGWGWLILIKVIRGNFMQEVK